MNDTKLLVFHVLRLGKNFENLSPEQISKYITINYAQVEEDWSKSKSNPFSFSLKGTKTCLQEDFDDFGNDPDGKKLFDSWKDFKLFCPPDDFDFVL